MLHKRCVCHRKRGEDTSYRVCVNDLIVPLATLKATASQWIEASGPGASVVELDGLGSAHRTEDFAERAKCTNAKVR